MEAKERLYLTEDREKLVKEGDSKGAFLYAAPGDEIPDDVAGRFGLVDGVLPEKGKKAASAKEKAQQEAEAKATPAAQAKAEADAAAKEKADAEAADKEKAAAEAAAQTKPEGGAAAKPEGS